MSESFGGRLRQRREQQEIALSTIAEATKIKATLLDALERDDVSHWPSGIFGRAFLRSYAQAIGLDPTSVVREFLELHPDPQFLEGHRNEAERPVIATAPPCEPADSSELEFSSARILPRAPLVRSAPVLASPPDPPFTPAPPEPPVLPAPDLTATAQLCTELGCVQTVRAAGSLVEKAAELLDATGVIVWGWDPGGERLQPVLTHGYSNHVVARLPNVSRDADNATAAAFRSAQTSVVTACGGVGALAIPLMAADACVGVLALELPAGGEEHEPVRAVATIIAAQFARVIASDRSMPVAERLLA
jgi:transcriptional regulator with XRE-family HTH domain